MVQPANDKAIRKGKKRRTKKFYRDRSELPKDDAYYRWAGESRSMEDLTAGLRRSAIGWHVGSYDFFSLE